MESGSGTFTARYRGENQLPDTLRGGGANEGNGPGGAGPAPPSVRDPFGAALHTITEQRDGPIASISLHRHIRYTREMNGRAEQ